MASKFISTLLLSLVFLSSVHADKAFEQGNEAYERKEYPEAIKAYEESLHDKQSFAQYYNLGNTHYQQEEYGQAILYYKKALILSPDNPEAEANLTLAYQTANLTPPEPTILEFFATFFNVNTWTWIFTASFWGLITFAVLPKVYPWKSHFVTPFLSLWILGALLSGTALYHYHSERNLSVVLHKETELKVAPTDSSPTSTFLAEGSFAKIEKEHEGFLFVQVGNHKEGWIKKTNLAQVWD